MKSTMSYLIALSIILELFFTGVAADDERSPGAVIGIMFACMFLIACFCAFLLEGFKQQQSRVKEVEVEVSSSQANKATNPTYQEEA